MDEGATQPVTQCVVCRAPLRGSVDGVAFGVGNRYLFAACHEHAPVVRAWAATAGRMAVSSLGQLVKRKLPVLWELLEGVRAERKELET